MKLTEDVVKKFDSLLTVCAVASIDKLIIEADGSLRGVDEKLSVALLSPTGAPSFNNHTLAINRLGILRSRMQLLKDLDGFQIEAIEARNGSDIAQLEMSAGGTKVQFRCSALANMKGVPKKLNDSDAWLVTAGPKEIKLMQQAVSAMGVETLTITAKQSGEVLFECIDNNNDCFSTKVADQATWIDEVKPEPDSKVFCNSYPAKSLLPLLTYASGKAGANVDVVIGGDIGVATVFLDDYSFVVVPKR